MKKLYFVRHGLSEMNKQGIFSGRTETPLNDEGREQSRAVGQELKNAGIDCIVTSPLARASETALLIAQEIGYPADKVVSSEFFMERDFGPLEGTTFEPNLVQADGVETVDDLTSRAAAGLKFLRSLEADTILVVSHGAIGRALRHALDPSIPFQPSPSFANAQVVELL
jgi:uncharacterized phosphatase